MADRVLRGWSLSGRLARTAGFAVTVAVVFFVAIRAATAVGASAGSPGGPQFVQQGPTLTPADETPSSQPAGSPPASLFGSSAAVSPDGATALFGGPGDSAVANGAGAAWVYVRSGAIWEEQAKLTAADAPRNGAFGSLVALSADGNTAVVAGIGGPALGPGGLVIVPGAVWVFGRSGSTWSQQTKLVPSDLGAGSFVPAGLAISADGNTVLVGAPGSQSQSGGVAVTGPRGPVAGRAWVFVRSGSSWSQMGAAVTGTGPGDEFGSSVSLSSEGNTALIGSPGDETAWLAKRSGVAWTRGPQLRSNETTLGGRFGASVALTGNGTAALIGSPGASVTGAVTGFELSNGHWAQQPARLLPKGEDAFANEGFGSSIAISADGRIALIGARGTGIVWSYLRTGPLWTQTSRLTPLSRRGTASGQQLALSADASLALIGDPSYSPGGTVSAYTYASGPVPLKPSLSGVSPTSGRPGSRVTLKGKNLATTYAVRFVGAAASTPVRVTAGTVVVTVPKAAKTGRITVETKIGSGRTAGTFTVLKRSIGAR